MELAIMKRARLHGKLIFLSKLLLIVCVAGIWSDTSFATYYHASPNNQPEINALRYNYNPPPPWIQGWTWFSRPNSDYYDYGGTFYYDPNNPVVEADFRGSIHSAITKSGVRSRAVNLGCNRVGNYCADSEGERREGSFSYMARDYLDRGTTEGYVGFYDAHDSVRVQIDLRKVPGFDINSRDVQDLEVYIKAQLEEAGRVRPHHTWHGIGIKVQRLSIWQITGNSWVTKQYNPADTTHYGTGWVNSKGNPNKITAHPDQVVDWWHSLHITGPMSPTESPLTTGVQQDVFNINTGRQILDRSDPLTSGAWAQYSSQRFSKAIPESDWKSYRWNRDYNGADYQTNWLETMHGKSKLEYVEGHISTNRFMYTRKIRQDDVGKRICQRAYWNKANHSAGWAWTYTPYSCVDVPYDYDLRPHVRISTDSLEEGAGRIEGIAGMVGNDGRTRSDEKLRRYAVARYVIRNGKVGTTTGGEGVAHAIHNANDVCGLVRRLSSHNDDCIATSIKSSNEKIEKGKTLWISLGESDDVSGLNLQFKDKVCYIAVVSAYNRDAGDQIYRYSAPACAVVGKRPKVQFWGGDVKTNQQIITSLSKKLSAGVENRLLTDAELKTAGLWPTGYSKTGNLLAASGNQADGHWSLVCAKNRHAGWAHGQRAYDTRGKVVVLPECSDAILQSNKEHQARTVVQHSKTNTIGGLRCPPFDANILGDVEHHCSNRDIGPWDRVGNNARWISINSYGLHTSAKNARDPSESITGNPQCGRSIGLVNNTYYNRVTAIFNCGNEYVFRLKNVNFPHIDNLQSIQLSFTGAVDNMAQVRVNGKAARMSSMISGRPGDTIQNYTIPGFGANGTMSAVLDGEAVKALKPTGNTIDIHIISDSSHIGVLIERMSVSYTKRTSNASTYGSWGEYGMLAADTVVSSSGAGLSSGPAGIVVAGSHDYNSLTFANTSGTFGHFSRRLVRDSFSAPKIMPNRGSLNGVVRVSRLSTGTYRAGDISLAGDIVAAGKSIVVEALGTVRIAGDLRYQTVGNARELPQLIIRAKNIIIEPDVTEVNAWLLTHSNGYISTCGQVVGYADWLRGVTVDTCKKQLRINGPVMADHLFLRRTYGAQNGSGMHLGAPAEIINLRADTYVWAEQMSRRSGAMGTMHLKELPPRL